MAQSNETLDIQNMKILIMKQALSVCELVKNHLTILIPAYFI